MNKPLVAGGVAAVSMMLPMLALAQDRPQPALYNAEARQEKIDVLKTQQQQRLDDIKAQQEQRMDAMKERRDERIASTTMRVEDRKEAIVERMDDRKARAPERADHIMASTTERVAERKAKMQDQLAKFKDTVVKRMEIFRTNQQKHKEDLKQKLESIKDERKQAIVGKVDDSLTTVNTNVLQRFTDSIAKIQEVLSGIVVREETARGQGVDVTTVDAAVAMANTDIAAAQSAIAAQTGKVYAMDISGEDTLREDVKVSRNALQADLKVVHEAVIAAGKSVRAVHVALVAVQPVVKDDSTN